ncbi:MAG: FlgD immunoglobulin-like domain containing protein, partial [Candidatus Cloacimonadaceae bacterium]
DRINAFIQATNTSQEASYVFIDSEAMPGYTYYYWLQHIDLSGEYEFHGPVSVHLNNLTPDMPAIPLVTSLQSIYPNPFNPAATISYGLAKASNVELVIMNTRGQVVRRLTSEYKNAGTYRVRWDGRSDSGTAVTTGVYLVRMTAGSYKTTQKLIMLK